MIRTITVCARIGAAVILMGICAAGCHGRHPAGERQEPGGAGLEIKTQAEGIRRALTAGNLRQAGILVERAMRFSRTVREPGNVMAIHAAAARYYHLAGEKDKAEELFQEMLAMFTPSTDAGTKAGILLNYSDLCRDTGRETEARKFLTQSLAAARTLPDPLPAVKAELNLIRLEAEHGTGPCASGRFQKLLERTGALKASDDGLLVRISLARLLYQCSMKAESVPEKETLQAMAEDVLTQAAGMADELRDPLARSLAAGNLAELHSSGGRRFSALELYRKAVFHAREAGAVHLLYRWQWHAGRLEASAGNTDRAVRLYQDAIRSIAAIKEDLAADCLRNTGQSFREGIGPVYTEYADILLRRSRSNPDEQAAREALKHAVRVVEQMKTIELQDYYQDECLARHQKLATSLDQGFEGVAVMYPVFLQNRVEIIVSAAGEYRSFTAGTDPDTLITEIRRFRKKLQDPSSRFLRTARKLYRWLIRSMEPFFSEHRIRTLVMIPDGSLRTIPVAAFHDGEKFLVERFAIACSPGLTLTDLVSEHSAESLMLLGGLTEPVQGFSALPYAAMELETLHEMASSQLLLDRDFNTRGMESALRKKPFSVVHIATHAQFDSSLEGTFLLTHDGRLSLDRLASMMGLGRFREAPVELLGLSACQTAVGDDQAALGLGGVAVRSGARSSLASLWFINDKATAGLMISFYDALVKDPDLSKAQALRKAQTAFLSSTEYRHPAYWSPFLLIGNWF